MEDFKCDECGCNGAKLRIDPYEQDINDNEVEVHICDVCYDERCQDI